MTTEYTPTQVSVPLVVLDLLRFELVKVISSSVFFLTILVYASD